MLKKSVFKISGMHCTSCSLTIDWELEDTKGIKAVKTSYASQVTEVTYDSDIINSGDIIDVIKKTGYGVS